MAYPATKSRDKLPFITPQRFIPRLITMACNEDTSQTRMSKPTLHSQSTMWYG